MYISSHVAHRIKILAKENNVQLKQMLSDLGLGLNTMANMKTSMLKADSLAKIADYLGCSVDYLLGRTEAASPSLSEEDRNLLETVHRLDPRDQGKLQGYAESLLSAEKYSEKSDWKGLT